MPNIFKSIIFAVGIYNEIYNEIYIDMIEGVYEGYRGEDIFITKKLIDSWKF